MRNTKMFLLIIAIGAIVFFIYSSRKPKDIFEAAQKGDKSFVKKFLKSGGKVDMKEPEWGATPLHFAAANDRVETIRVLLSAGADIHCRDSDNKTPLHYAVREGHVKATETLISEGADVNAADSYGITPLFGSTSPWNKSCEVAELLIENGADVNYKDNYGTTALNRAVQNGRPDILKTLLSHGGNPYLKDIQGTTVIQLANSLCRGARIGVKESLKRSQKECLKILERYDK